MEMFWLLVNIFVYSLVSLILVLLVSTVAFYWYFTFLRVTKYMEEIPGIRAVPILSYWVVLMTVNAQIKYISAEAILLQIAVGICHMYDKSRIAKLWVSVRPFVFFFKPETVEAVLSHSNAIDKSNEYSILHPWLKTGLLTSSGNKWHSRRKLLTPSFHFRILEEYVSVFNKESQILVQKLMKLENVPWFDIAPLIKMCTLDIICETTMGVTLNAQNSEDNEYVRATLGMGEALLYRGVRPWLWLDQLFFLLPQGRRFQKNLQILHNFSRKVIQLKKEEMLRESEKDQDEVNKSDGSSTNPGKNKRAFLELLLEHHLSDNSLTEEDIQEEVDTFMFEGHDTTAVAITWALYNLGLRPDIQAKVFSELEDIFGEDSERTVTSEDIKKMKYLECVIKESLRLYPSVPFIAREVKKPFQVLKYTVVPGMLCFVFPFALHRDPEVFPNPEYFDPERFSPENSAGRHPYAYIPFSAGARNCIGQRFALMEEKIVLANILRRFEVESLDHRDTLHLTSGLILRNDKPIRMKLKCRLSKETECPKT